MGKKNRKQVRTPQQRQAFYSSAHTFGGEETEKNNNALTLDGSADTKAYPEFDIHEKVKAPSLQSRVLLHKKEVLITAVFIPVILAVAKWIIDVKAEQKYINRVLDETKIQVEQLTADGSVDYTSFVTKENLELKLELIERDLKGLIPDTGEIEKRLEEIEEELAQIQGK